jgi:hypothetical protein
MRFCRSSVALPVVFACLGLSGVASASPVTWVYQGTLATSGRADAMPVGAPVELALSFDSAAPDLLAADPACGVYWGAATTQVAGSTYSGPVFIEMYTSGACGRPGGSMYVVGVAPSGPSVPYPTTAPEPRPDSGIPASRLYLETGLAQSGDALPSLAPSYLFFELFFDHIPCGGLCGSADPYAFRVTSWVTLTPVPEPLATVLVGVGAAAFLRRRRGQRRSPR